MSFKHNKKRNAGLIYEFFIRSIGSNVLSGNNEAIVNAKKLFKKYFQPGTALANEVKLFKTIMETHGVTKERAEFILNHVKSKCKTNEAVLELEKTALIHEINKTIGPEFFDIEVSDFKNYASFQILLNNWRSETISESIIDLSLLEESLKESMQKEKKQTIDFTVKTQEEIDMFVVEQIKEKLGTNLSDEQSTILSFYVNESTPRVVVKKELEKQTAKTKTWLSEAKLSNKLPNELTEKFEKLIQKMEKISKQTDISDQSIEFFLGAIKAREECGVEK
jgi:hypothetical protein